MPRPSGRSLLRPKASTAPSYVFDPEDEEPRFVFAAEPTFSDIASGLPAPWSNGQHSERGDQEDLTVKPSSSCTAKGKYHVTSDSAYHLSWPLATSGTSDRETDPRRWRLHACARTARVAAPLGGAEYPASRVGALLAIAGAVEALHSLAFDRGVAPARTTSAVISMAIALFLISAPFVAAEALRLLIAGWFARRRDPPGGPLRSRP